jgi:hypothetical protein
MGYTAQSGSVIIAQQTAPGATVTDANMLANGQALKLTSGSLAGNRDLLTPDPEIGSGRDTSDAYAGATSFSGDYEAYLRANSVATFLKGSLGLSSSATATGVTTHTITPADGQLPFYTVYEEISSGLERFKYTDAVINTMHLESGANEFLKMTAGLIARNVVAGSPDIVPDTILDNGNLFVGTSVSVTYNGVTLPAKSFSLDITNNFEDDNFYLGSLFLGDLTAKAREITASVTLRHETAAYMKQALFGTPTATQIGGLTTKQALVITATAYEDIPGSTPLTKYSLQLTLPKVIFEPFAFEVSGDDALENDVSMRAVRPDTTVPIMTAVIKSSKATIS